jgi:hypothetical protein
VITFIGIMLFAFAYITSIVMKHLGVYSDRIHRPTDLIVLAPFFGSIGCFVWVLYQLCVRFLP